MLQKSTKADWSKDDIGDLTGRIVVITGANSGIGYHTAKALAEKGAEVIFACRNEAKVRQAMRELKVSQPNANLAFIRIDLEDMHSIRAFCREMEIRYNQIDILINNAGVMVPPKSETRDGFELQFGCNFLGHFLLTAGLLELLEKSDSPRIINLGSLMHLMGKIDFNNLNAEKKYDAWGAYSQSKLACIIFHYELNRRLKARGSKIIAVGAHPGVAVTNLVQHSLIARLALGMLAQDAESGSLPTLYAATQFTLKGGEYIGPNGRFGTKGKPALSKSSKVSHDRNIASRLWEEAENSVGEKFLS